jgi:hypothetical protein
VAASGERDIPRDRLWSVREVSYVSASRWGPCIHGGCCAVARRVGGSAGGCDGVDHAGLGDWQWQVSGQRLDIGEYGDVHYSRGRCGDQGPVLRPR